MVALVRIAVRFDQTPLWSEAPTWRGASSRIGLSLLPLTNATVRDPAVREPSITSINRVLSV